MWNLFNILLINPKYFVGLSLFFKANWLINQVSIANKVIFFMSPQDIGGGRGRDNTGYPPPQVLGGIYIPSLGIIHNIVQEK